MTWYAARREHSGNSSDGSDTIWDLKNMVKMVESGQHEVVKMMVRTMAEVKKQILFLFE